LLLVAYKDSLNQLHSDGDTKHLVQFIKKAHSRAKERSKLCSGLVYVHKRNDTALLANLITKETGIIAVVYHAGLKKADRAQAQEAWMSGKAQIAVCTVAFGMGIDLGHVRYVVHWSISKSVDGFYQESGRAGRDGEAGRSSIIVLNRNAYVRKSSVDDRVCCLCLIIFCGIACRLSPSLFSPQPRVLQQARC
jgi:superfamily II DNA helicase RecQ